MYTKLVLSLSSEVQFFTEQILLLIYQKAIQPCGLIGNSQPER